MAVPLVPLGDIDTTDATCIDNLCRSPRSHRAHWGHIVLFVLDVLGGSGPHKCAHINVHMHTYLCKHAQACTFTKSIYCNSFIYGGSVYLAYVMGRLIGGFSNYEPGKAAGWRRQSDPSLLPWCISRAPTTADPIHMAINGALYINVIPVPPPTHKCMDYCYYQLQQSNVLLSGEVLWMQIPPLHVIK